MARSINMMNKERQAIRDAYTKLKGVKKNGVRLYAEEFIINELSNQFFKAKRTIENIVYHRI